MGRRPLCECQGQMVLADDPRPPCLHCGRPTPPGKWRCARCQKAHDDHSVVEAAREILNAARAEASRERWGEGN